MDADLNTNLNTNLNANQPGARYRPDPRFADPQQLSRTLTTKVLPLVTRPARYIGGELGAVRDDWSDERVNILLTFPDAYEVGTSHLGLRILYSRLNEQAGVYADLAFAVWPDMEAMLRQHRLPLFALESRRAAGQFDVLGFSLGYELTYTNVLTMLDLAGIPLLAKDRGDGDPLVVAGGSCTFNPTVMGAVCDAMLIGDGEEAVCDLAAAVAAGKSAGLARTELLDRVHGLPGVWHPGVREPITTRVVADLNAYQPPSPLVPVTEPVHDRIAVEVMRGCVRGCRFCQAGMITRPVRERDVAAVVAAADTGVQLSGQREVNLLSLSTSDYSGLAPAISGIQEQLAGTRTNVVLPSLRVDAIDSSVYERVGRERPASFTFAPEAGSQRLRDVINKQIDEQDIVTAVATAFGAGVKHVKLYFMIGLPTETDADLDGLVALVGRVVALAPRGGAQVHVSVSPFAPKAHTPFQWAGQISRAEIARRNGYVAKRLRRWKVKLGLREPAVSFLEALLGLGDEALGRAVMRAWRLGARFDGWTEHFNFAIWQQAITEEGIDPDDYLTPRDPEAPLPWDSIAAPVSREFLAGEWRQAAAGVTLPDCRLTSACFDCAACGDGIDHVFAHGVPGAAGGQLEHKGPVAVASKGRRDSRPGDAVAPSRSDSERRWRIWRQQASDKCWYRIEFAKTGDAIFLGHLDFQRLLQLALLRSDLPAAYSKGYHPHPLMKFGPPLPVGVGGECEYFDVALESELPDWLNRFAAELQPDVQLHRSLLMGATVPRSIDQGTERQDYRVTLPPPHDGGPDVETIESAVEKFLASREWIYLRQRSKRDVEIDVRPLVPIGGLTVTTEVSDDGDGAAVLRVSLLRSAAGVSLPVHGFLACLFGDSLPEPRLCHIVRTGLFGRDAGGRWRTPLEEVGEIARRYWLRKRINA